MKINTREIGFKKEEQVCQYLKEQGYLIVDRNWYWSNKGEIDIVAIDPNRFGEKYWVFIEVKSRDWSMDMSLAALRPQKIQQLKKLAKIYLLKNKLKASKTNISFDFIAVHRQRIEHIKNIV